MKQGEKAVIKNSRTEVTVESDEFIFEGEPYHFVKTWVGGLDTTHTIAARHLVPIEKQEGDKTPHRV